MAYLLGGQATDIGNIRKTFFYNQTRVTTDVISSRVSDFEIDGKSLRWVERKRAKSNCLRQKKVTSSKTTLNMGQVTLFLFGSSDSYIKDVADSTEGQSRNLKHGT